MPSPLPHCTELLLVVALSLHSIDALSLSFSPLHSLHNALCRRESENIIILQTCFWVVTTGEIVASVRYTADYENYTMQLKTV